MYSWRGSNILELSSSEDESSTSRCESSSLDSPNRGTGVDAHECPPLEHHDSNTSDMMDVDGEYPANGNTTREPPTVDHQLSPTSRSSADDPEDCFLCCEDLICEGAADSGIVRMSCCKLVWHRDCMTEWYKACRSGYRTPNCPTCRKEFKIEGENSVEEEATNTSDNSYNGDDEEYDEWNEGDPQNWDELRIVIDSLDFAGLDYNDPRFYDDYGHFDLHHYLSYGISAGLARYFLGDETTYDLQEDFLEDQRWHFDSAFSEFSASISLLKLTDRTGEELRRITGLHGVYYRGQWYDWCEALRLADRLMSSGEECQVSGISEPWEFESREEEEEEEEEGEDEEE